MNKTKKVCFVTEHRGEVANTGHDLAFPLTPSCEVDFSEERVALAGADDFRLVRVRRFGKVELELPFWMSPEELVRDFVSWKWVFGLGAKKVWPETWLRFLRSLHSSPERLCVIGLFRTYEKAWFRSAYRQSLAEHLVSWLEIPKEKRVFDSPFSNKQWGSLLTRYVVRKAKQLDNALYLSSSCSI